MTAWSKRKAAVQAEADRLEAEKLEAAMAAQQAELAQKPEAEVLQELDLPNPDAMQAGDDFSAFMKAQVPVALRNRALKTLWRSNPVLANIDNLVDYGEDFTGNGDKAGAIKTIYQVGKGMLAREAEQPAPAPSVPETPAAKTLEAPSGGIELDDGPLKEAAEDAAPAMVAAEPAPEAPASEPIETLPPPRRRMRFVFASDPALDAPEMETL